MVIGSLFRYFTITAFFWNVTALENKIFFPEGAFQPLLVAVEILDPTSVQTVQT